MYDSIRDVRGPPIGGPLNLKAHATVSRLYSQVIKYTLRLPKHRDLRSRTRRMVKVGCCSCSGMDLTTENEFTAEFTSILAGACYI